jgi:hypothetical protein
MTKHFTAVTLFISICIVGFLSIPTYTFKPVHKPQQKVPKKDRMDLAWAQENEMTIDPELGYVPRERLLKAFEYKEQLLNKIKGKAAIPGVNWVERGPRNCGGRTRAILVDLNDPTRKTIWSGSVAGGLWKTSDITQTNPAWTNQNDFFDNMAISCITQAPGNPQVMYFGTGEGNNNADAVRGLGIWKSTNGGTSWSQLSSTNNSNYHYCNRVFALGNGDIILAATRTGLYRSVNGGNTWTKVLGTGISSAGGNDAEDIERTSNGTLYVTMNNGGTGSGTIHKSFNNGATWTTPRTINGLTTGREIELAVTEVDSNVIWGIVESGGIIRSIIRSTNAGNNFDTTTAYPNDADGGIPDNDISRSQGWYDISIAADPNNVNVCYVGGIDLFKTTNAGSSWQQVSHWYGGFGFQEVHADQHLALFEPGNSNVIYFGNDGGIYRSANATATIPTISTKEINYNTTQFYAADIHPTTDNFYLAGAQDNGSHRFTQSGINNTTEVTGGDGAFCHIDQNQPAYQFTSYVYNAYYRSTNSGTSFSGSGLTFGTRTGRFINPTDYDDSLNIMYAAYAGGNYLRWSNPQTGNTTTTVTVTALNNIMVSAVKVSPNILGRVYFGTSSGRVVRVDNAHSASGTVAGTLINPTGLPAGYVNCIEVESGNDDHVIIVYSSYGVNSIWETRNGGIAWTSVEGNLPDMPIRWALMNPNRPHQVLIATELGVWSTDSLNSAATNWQPTNSGLSNTRTDMLKLRKSDKMVVAATHGRGVFTSNVFGPFNPSANVNFSADKRVTYINTPVQFTSSSTGATTYLWNFGDGTTSTLAAPIKNYTTAGNYNVTLTINGGPGTLTINNYIKILPYRGVPYLAADGGNFETNQNDFGANNVSGTPFELGFSTIAGKSGTFSGNNAWVTSISTNYIDNSEAQLLTPNFNCTAAGNYTLSFYTKYKVETTWDGFRVEYSIDKGTNWLPLGTNTATNWYDYANTSTGRPFPSNEAYFSNATLMTSFVQKSFTTNVFAGQSQVCFRFIFKSDVSLADAGVAIDNIEFNGPVNSALPVSIGNLIAKRLNKDEALINWNTYSEKNNKGFEIYKKDATNTNWVLVDFVSGKINSSEAQYYSFTDANAGHTAVAYKLKQLDIDGGFKWSKEVIIPPYLEQTSDDVLSILPAGGKQFNINPKTEFNITIWLYDAHGRVIKQLSFEPQQQKIDLSELPDGVYFIQAQSSDGKQQVIKLPVF